MKFSEFFEAVCTSLKKTQNWGNPKTLLMDRPSMLDIIHDQYGLAMEDALRDSVQTRGDFPAYAGQAAYKINEALRIVPT